VDRTFSPSPVEVQRIGEYGGGSGAEIEHSPTRQVSRPNQDSRRPDRYAASGGRERPAPARSEEPVRRRTRLPSGGRKLASRG